MSGDGRADLGAVLELAHSVLSDLEIDAVLERVVRSARALTGARYGALGVLDEKLTSLARFITDGMDEAVRDTIGAPPTGRGVLGELILHPVPLRLADVGSHPRSYGFPIDHPQMRSFLGVPVLIAGRPYGNLYLTDKQDGAEFTEADEQQVVLLAAFAALAIDHARRFSESEARRLALQSSVDALDATLQISRALSGVTDLRVILDLVAKRGRALVSARTVVIEVTDGAELLVAAGAGFLPDGLVGRRLPREESPASTAMRTGQTQRLGDELNRARFEQRGLGAAGLELTDGLVVPLAFRGEVYGVLTAVDRLDGGDSFSAEQRRLLEAFAASAASALATAQSVADERRRQSIAAAEAERSRWARDLHDETLQNLGSLRLLLSSAQRREEAELADAVGEALEQLDADIASLHRLITELRPAALDELGVGAAIQALADRATAAGLEVELSLDLAYEGGSAPDRLDPEIESAIYRIAQESLTNATRHGGARRASVEVLEEDGAVSMRVRDDGRGFDTAAHTAGFGLLGMRERAQLLAGTLGVSSKPGGGTTVEARLPARHRRPAGGRSTLADQLAL